LETIPTLAQTRIWHDVDEAKFLGEIVPLGRPAILKGLVCNWPATQEAMKSPRALCDYIRSFDLGRPVQTFIGAPSIKGRFFYRDDMRGFNFERKNELFRDSIERVLAHMDDPDPPSLYAGAVSTADGFPGFARENALDLVDKSVVSRIWAGNAVSVSAHYDLSDNIACVVAGRRRFVLFPPEQLPNLYVGPLDFTMAGQPASMVDLAAPDFARYPRFAEALANAEEALLEPGDAVYIPTLWWHHVTSLDRFNLLVNYWWNDAKPGTGSPFEALIHGILSISDLPESRRQAWRGIFDHYVFQTKGEPVPHLAPEHRGVLGKMTPQLAAYIKGWLIKALQRP
jgi:hypothetical protein